MATVRTRLKAPRSVAPGERISVRTLITHPMDTGLHRDQAGNLIPRRIINRVEATFNGEAVLTADLHPAISANPYLQFEMVVPESGDLQVTWTDDDGSVHVKSQRIEAG